MNFEQVSSHPLRPFPNWISVNKAKTLGIIPPEYKEIFSDLCRCGSERIAQLESGSVTGIACCDPRCPKKQAYQLNDIFAKFGFKGIGPAICTKVVESFHASGNVVTIADILINSRTKNPLTGAEETKWSSALDQIVNSRVSFGRFIANLSYPTMGSKMEDVFKGINSMDDFVVKAKQKGGLINFFFAMGVKNTTSLYYFMIFCEEIAEITKHFSDTIIQTSEVVLPICMTGHMRTILGNFSKDEFLQQCNILCEIPGEPKKFDIVSVESVPKATFIIVGEDSIQRNTTKFKAAVNKQEQMHLSGELSTDKRIWFTPDQFLNLLVTGDEN